LAKVATKLAKTLLWQSAAPLIGKPTVGKLLHACPKLFDTFRFDMTGARSMWMISHKK